MWDGTRDSDVLQQWLKDHDCHGVDAVLVTMRLLSCTLAEAQRAFFAAPCRRQERDFHNRVMKGLEAAGDEPGVF
ncbi:hypothetical protein [Streptomyces sp. NK08204]|uniref:hypothetical protein n=1 Tax=Streptomyces sp. NK08204 TaxID=2873260 RepID=UPI001CEC3C81|nr:hypothetical protein [Streptomyces sp. NK08204]